MSAWASASRRASSASRSAARFFLGAFARFFGFLQAGGAFFRALAGLLGFAGDARFFGFLPGGFFFAQPRGLRFGGLARFLGFARAAGIGFALAPRFVFRALARRFGLGLAREPRSSSASSRASSSAR